MIIRIDENIAINTEDIVKVERCRFENENNILPTVVTYITLRIRPEAVSVLGDIFDKVVDACNGVNQ